MTFEILEQYLYSRGRTEPNVDLDAHILADEDKLARIAGTWRDRKEEIMLVVGAQMAKIEVYLVNKAPPVEVTVMRQALAELMSVLQLFAKYESEYERREKKTGAEPEPQASNAETQGEQPVL